MSAVNYAIYGCPSSRTTPRVITIQEVYNGGRIVAFITQDRVTDDNLKLQIENLTLYTLIFQYISNWSKVFEHLPTLFLQHA